MQGDEYGYTDADHAGDSTDGGSAVASAAGDPGSVAHSPDTGAQPEGAAHPGDMDTPAESAASAPAVPSFTPQSAPGSMTSFYQVVTEDTSLDVIASKLGLSSTYHELFQPNMATLDMAARAAGYPGGSDQGTILIPGTWLEVRLPAQPAPS